MRIAIVVHGRFHAFDLALALQRRGHVVRIFTNYPAWAAARFGVPREALCSLWLHGLVQRIVQRVPGAARWQPVESFLHRWFGSWAARHLVREHWDVVHCWSGVSEELLRALRGTGTETWLMRGSAHIQTQLSLLQDEERRVGVRVDKPSQWMVAREAREYELTSSIRVASTFAMRTFVDQGVPASRLRLLPLGANLPAFRASSTVIEARQRRINQGQPLRLLYVGACLYRKGMYDLATLAGQLDPARYEIKIVGQVTPECRGLAVRLAGRVDVTGHVRQSELPQAYAWGDVFVFPTIEDGFAVVLSQAQASGLPILSTPNCAGPDLLEEGKTGWVVPVRDPGALAQRLRWCDEHRAELAEMVRRIGHENQPRDWNAVAQDFDYLYARRHP